MSVATGCGWRCIMEGWSCGWSTCVLQGQRNKPTHRHTPRTAKIKSETDSSKCYMGDTHAHSHKLTPRKVPRATGKQHLCAALAESLWDKKHLKQSRHRTENIKHLGIFGFMRSYILKYEMNRQSRKIWKRQTHNQIDKRSQTVGALSKCCPSPSY